MRLLLLSAAALVCAASHAQAQVQPEPPARVRARVTPFIGTTLPLEVSGTYVLRDSVGTVQSFRELQGGNLQAGIELELPLRGRFTAVGSASTSGRSSVTFENHVGNDTSTYAFSGARTFFTKLGLRYRLPEPTPDTRRHHPSGYITVAPAIVHLNYDESFFGPVRGKTTDNTVGLSLGADATSRLGASRFALHLGIEDFLQFNGVPYGARVRSFYPTVRSVDVGRVNTLSVRVGATYAL